jgi:hypothetical protein
VGFVLVVALLLLAGCNGGAAAKFVLPPGSDMFAVTIQHFWSQLDANNFLHRHQAWFVLRRILQHVREHPDWLDEPGQPKLIEKVKAELTLVAAYADRKIGTVKQPGALITGAGEPSPRHLDIHDLAKVTSDSTEFDRAKIAAEYLQMRYTRTSAIIWRAAGIDPNVWQSAPNPLDVSTLDEIVDRRLRAVERMEFNVNSAQDRIRTLEVQGPEGPWIDKFRARIFEYGTLPVRYFDAWSNVPGWEKGKTQLTREEPLVGKASRAFWKVDGMRWIECLTTDQSSPGPAEVIDRLFTASEDFVQRNVMYCPQAVTAVMLEALLFAKRRRSPSQVDTFNKIFARPKYVKLGALVRLPNERPTRLLMDDTDADDPFFSNRQIFPNELQVGDEIVVWNNYLYTVLYASGAWINEYSLVMNIDADPSDVDLDLATDVEVAGHGLTTKKIPGIQKELADELGNALKTARKLIVNTLAEDPNAVAAVHSSGRYQVVYWAPYPELASIPTPAIGSWWIYVSETFWKSVAPTMNDAVRAIPRCIGKDAMPHGADFRDPPDVKGIYFPLFEPIYKDDGFGSDSWKAYLVDRAVHRLTVPKFRPIPLDSRLAPGVFFVTETKIPGIRPQVGPKRIP